MHEGYSISDNPTWSELMALAQQGHSKAYAQLLTEVSQFAKPYLINKLRQAQYAEDVLQDILLAIHRARHTFDSTRPFRPWLIAIMESRIAEFWRKHKRKEEFEAKGQVEDDGWELFSAEEEFSQLEIENLQKAFDHLSLQQKEIVYRLKFDGKSIKDVASEMEMSESAVKVAAHRGYKKLNEYIKEYL